MRSLRYYEEQGLLVSTRTPSGQRLYVEGDVARVAFIQCMYAAGLSSRTIVELLPCSESPSPANSEAAHARLVEERERLAEHIEQLRVSLASVDRMILANEQHARSLAG